jgi:alpha-N-arabinofuranosidase
MPAVPEFILRKLFVQGSLKAQDDGFSFALNNSFAPATVTGFNLEVDGQKVPPERLSLSAQGEAPLTAVSISDQSPYPLSVGVLYIVQARGIPVGIRLTLHVNTREAGLLSFTVQPKAGAAQPASPAAGGGPRWLPRGLFRRPLKAEAEVDAGSVIGEINPYIYGHFIEHLERCVYGGIWSEDGARLREDTLALIQDLHPPVIRYPGGNFASGYHWEDGIGPKEARPPRFDHAWQSWESNQVGTDEFLALCVRLGTDPFLVVNDGSGTPEEAARWIAYCNRPASEEQGRRRADNGHPSPYGVRLWGVGNEVWGPWQIGQTSAAGYAARLNEFTSAMRAVDPSIRIVAVGDNVLSDAPDDPGRQWNETVLRQAADQIDYLSFHIYQPDQSGWQESYDLEALHYTVCAAPLTIESIITRMAGQVARLAPGRHIRIALDEWNLWLAPPEGAGSMHQVVYTLRDALYAAGVFNTFHRQCDRLAIANLAQLVNVLPAIVTDEKRAYATPIYYPFWMYRHMQRLALNIKMTGPTFDSDALSTIAAQQGVPYLDMTATRDETSCQVTLGLVNRHPAQAMRLKLGWRGFSVLKLRKAWLLSGPDPSAANSFDAPEQVCARPADLPETRGDMLQVVLPASSVMVIMLGK